MEALGEIVWSTNSLLYFRVNASNEWAMGFELKHSTLDCSFQDYRGGFEIGLVLDWRFESKSYWSAANAAKIYRSHLSPFVHIFPGTLIHN